MFSFIKRKKIFVLPLLLMLLSNQPVHAMRARLFSTIMRSARLANLYLANVFTASYTYGMLKGYYGKEVDEKNKQLPDVPQDVQDWARKQLETRMKNVERVQLKIDDSTKSTLAAKRTVRNQFVKFDSDAVYELKEAFDHQNDDSEHNRRLAKLIMHNASYTLDHEAKHLIENHQLKTIGFFPATAVSTHFAGKKVMQGVKWVLKVGTPKTILSLVVHSLGLIVGGFGKRLLNLSIPDWVFIRRQEREADDFANRCAESAEKLKYVEKFWREKQKKLEKKHDTKYQSLARILHALADDRGHPMPGDRADRIAEMRKLKFGSKEKNK